MPTVRSVVAELLWNSTVARVPVRTPYVFLVTEKPIYSRRRPLITDCIPVLNLIMAKRKRAMPVMKKRVSRIILERYYMIEPESRY